MTAVTEHLIAVEGQDLRVVIRGGRAGATSLLIINGIGVSLELTQPFVDALDPVRSGDVIDLYGGSARAGPEWVSEAMHDNNRLGSSRGYRYQLAASFGWSSAPFLPRRARSLT